MELNYAGVFARIRPGFFQEDYIRELPEEDIFDEQVLDLHTWQEGVPVDCPPHITFGRYRGDLEALHAAVRQVDEDWVQWFTRPEEVYCAFDGDKVASFCLLDDFGEYDGLRIGAPGCVGTVPAYRRQGIGLRMVQKATSILQQQGFDLSWIHYTHVGHWYARLGYKTVLKWNGKGIVDM